VVVLRFPLKELIPARERSLAMNSKPTWVISDIFVSFYDPQVRPGG